VPPRSGCCEIIQRFTDLGLPGGMNGRQFADTARDIRPNLLVKYARSYARNIMVHHGMLDARVELMVKPF
jgi:hypothetical protein